MRLENDTGKILTVLLITAALVGAVWIFFNMPVSNTSNVDNKITTERLLNCTCKCKD